MSPSVKFILVLMGFLISFAPTLVFLLAARQMNQLLNHHMLELLLGVGVTSLLGGFICLKVLIPKWWVVWLSLPFLAAGFFVANFVVGLFIGCLTGFPGH